MRKSVILLVMLLLALLLAACDEDQPPTQIFVIITATPEGAGDDATPVAQAPAATAEVTDSAPVATEAVTDEPLTATASTPEQSVTATTPSASPGTPTADAAAAAAQTTTPAAPTLTPTPDLFPTPITAQVQIAEQDYEHGRMFWIRHTRQIWVMAAYPDDPDRGDWYCFNDTFEEGEPEIDPDITAPEDLIQPRRGFGKLWRAHENIKDAIGWATTPEFELTSTYTYIFGGYVEDGQYFQGPGEHRMTTFDNQTISFFEGDVRGDCQGGTWRLHEATE